MRLFTMHLLNEYTLRSHSLIGLILVLCLTSFPAAAQDEPKARSQDEQKKITSYEELVQAYKDRKFSIEQNAPSRTLLFETSREDFRGVMVVKWDEQNGVVHFIQTMPLRVKKEDYGLFLEAAQRLNHGFLFPGIGVNLANGGTYYRLSIPVAPRGYLYEYEVGRYTTFTLAKAYEFLPTLKGVLDGKIKMDELILTHQKRLRELGNRKKTPVKLDAKYEREFMDEKWELDFSKPGQVTVFREGKEVVVSRIEVTGDELKIEDTEGEHASAGKGTYRVFKSDDKLSFRLVQDPADNRKQVLAGGVWNLVK